MKNNILTNIPDTLPKELIETLLTNKHIKIEKIVSKGHTSPAQGWYNQDKNEWVIVIKGAAKLKFEDKIVELKEGDYINIPAYKKHKVIWTSPDVETIWIAIFYV
jgi:cupin 2 domain-containing protein